METTNQRHSAVSACPGHCDATVSNDTPGGGMRGMKRIVAFPRRRCPAGLIAPLLLLFPFGNLFPLQSAKAQCLPDWADGFGDPGREDFVYSMAVFHDGTEPALYAGGAFTTAGGVSAANIAKWN